MAPVGWGMLSVEKFFPRPQAINEASSCWWSGDRAQFFPELCCEPPAGFRSCFGEDYKTFLSFVNAAEGKITPQELTYESCCLRQEALPWPLQDRPALPLPALGKAAPVRQGSEKPLAVDLVVRSWHEDIELLTVLLSSMKIFWPFGRLQTHVTIVLDAEATETENVCKELEKFGAWVRCVGEALPFWLSSNRTRPQLKRPKAARVHWSTFWSDWYAPDADYVGVIDSDVVFHSYASDVLLFAPALDSLLQSLASVSAEEMKLGSRPRPVIFGSWSSTFAFSALAVQDDYPQANFMDSLPMIMHRADFAALRHHITKRFRLLSGRPRLDFDKAFLLASHQVDMFAASTGWFVNYQGEFLCFQAAMGAFIWRFRQSSYFFSIRGGYERGLSAHTTCPSLHPALHATELKRRARHASVSYSEEGKGMMAAGLCAAAMVRGVLRPLDAERCRRAPYQASDLLSRSDDVGAYPWTAATRDSSERCGPRTSTRLLADFWQLLPASLGMKPLRQLLHWALKSNATGKYLDTEDIVDGDDNRLEVLNG